ncbi:Inositol 1,4,5-trisphosphate receptor-interacting protein [Collichthys lucidus]|uniref:Inositol 1,4,5-trisphosphate receptor-interacting protein n=1 Tax=Collichthys lucidus TaxID=240159 RepID=A0A4V6ASR8_COLLU|nr:Inositol 1,4,5-trisphosphate receptor-interacting protein [Collichthys lucidus]
MSDVDVVIVQVYAIVNRALIIKHGNFCMCGDEGIKQLQLLEAHLCFEGARVPQRICHADKKVEQGTEKLSTRLLSDVSVLSDTVEYCPKKSVPVCEVRRVVHFEFEMVEVVMLRSSVETERIVLYHFKGKCIMFYTGAIGRVWSLSRVLLMTCWNRSGACVTGMQDMEVGDFVGIGSMFESWKVCKPLMCDLIVPFSPPDPYSFQFHMWCSPSSDVPPGLQGCGKIKVTKFGENEKGCLCGSANMGDDMLCLLHSRNDTPKVDHSPDELLCSRNTPFLAKDQVMKWFQISVTKAWGRISHKYDFEVTFRNLDAAGALTIRFRSGKVIMLNIIPVVQLEDTDAYFVSHFPSDCDSPPDPYWPLSFAVYEKNLLKHFAKRLPQNSCHLHCLQIVTFLHRKQTGLTGKSALTNYHLKTALLHLLLSKKPSVWGVESMEHRLRDLLSFLQRSLQEKRLHHVLIGNSKVPGDVQVPLIIRKAEPINLFRPLVLQRELHATTVRHFHEMLRNAPVLIQEYTPHLTNGGLHHILDESL